MAGLNKDVPQPTRIVVHQASRLLEIEFADSKIFQLPFELMRVYSPSAEVRGHGPGQETLQTGKRSVGISGVEPVGNYAIQPHFDDGHSTGIFSWDYLYWLGDDQDTLWQDYLARLEKAGASRDLEGGAGVPTDLTQAAASTQSPISDDSPSSGDAAGGDASGGLNAKSLSRPR